ncbi:MAG: hypothetical protein RR942_06085 [Romboutsia sp.]
MNLSKTKKDEELFKMMLNFKQLSKKEQSFVFGLTEGILLCKPGINITTINTDSEK